MTFTESNTVEALVRDILCGGVTPPLRQSDPVWRGGTERSSRLGWHYLGAQQLPRQAHEILVEDHVREALIHLNPEIAAQPDRGGRRAVPVAGHPDGRADGTGWSRRTRSSRRGSPESGRCHSARTASTSLCGSSTLRMSSETTMSSAPSTTPSDRVRTSDPRTWYCWRTAFRWSSSRRRHRYGRARGRFDGATQIRDDYERNVPDLFVPMTGFDAPILQAMYLDKPLRGPRAVAGICRTNRPYGQTKTHGLIVDYLGVFDDVAQAIQFDEKGITRVVTNLNELPAALPGRDAEVAWRGSPA